jgi:hypothetical protein
MAEETKAGAGAGTGVSGSGMSAADVAAPGGDVKFLEAPVPTGDTAEADAVKTAEATKTAEETAAAAKAAEEGKSKEINLSALEEGQPEWLGKVTDEAAKGEIQKLLDFQKKFTERFKDAEDLDAFFKELPGGREQIAALQTLSREVAELDGHIQANTPESNAIVVSRYQGEAPDGGVGLTRAGLINLSKTQPEAYSQIGTDVANATLKSHGIGADLQTVVSAVAEMRQAMQKDDGEAFGKAAAKLLGEPKADAKVDPSIAKANETAKAAETERVKAQTESWQFRNEKSGGKIDNHVATEIGKLLSKVLPASISEKDRNSLREEIGREALSQLFSNAYLNSQFVQLVGFRQSDGKGGFDNSKVNLTATQENWDAATKLAIDNLTPKLIAKATSKIVTQWSRDRAASNKEARDKARNAAATKDVGAAAAAGGKPKPPLTAEQLAKMTDEEFLNY